MLLGRRQPAPPVPPARTVNAGWSATACAPQEGVLSCARHRKSGRCSMLSQRVSLCVCLCRIKGAHMVKRSGEGSGASGYGDRRPSKRHKRQRPRPCQYIKWKKDNDITETTCPPSVKQDISVTDDLLTHIAQESTKQCRTQGQNYIHALGKRCKFGVLAYTSSRTGKQALFRIPSTSKVWDTQLRTQPLQINDQILDDMGMTGYEDSSIVAILRESVDMWWDLHNRHLRPGWS